MRLLIHVAMAATLIVADAAQAASLVTAGANGQTRGGALQSSAERYKRITDRDVTNWRRISASICTGCGAPPPPLEIARAEPRYLQALRDAEAGTQQAEKAKSTQPPTAPRIQSAAFQREKTERTRAERQVRRYARVAGRTRKHARYARQRLVQAPKRLALLQAQKERRTLRLSEIRRRAPAVRVAELQLGAQRDRGLNSGDQPRPVPLPPRRPDALCVYDRGLVRAEVQGSEACVSSE